MDIEPGYGETSLEPEEADALTPQAREIFGDQPRKVELYEAEHRRRAARIAVELRGSLENIRYRWEHTEDWAPRELGIAVHAETVRIHGFVDGNGRSTRLLADLVFLAAQDAEAIAETYDWRIDKKEYIALLREYDLTRDPKPLAEFVPVRRLDDAET